MTKTTVQFTDDINVGRPYWWDGVTWPEGDVQPPEKADLLVIGAGYTGLSAAIAAHDKGARVAVIEVGRPGFGASTRNGGMVGAHPRLGWDTLANKFGASVADAIFAEAVPALDWVRKLIEREQIDCDFQQTGRIQLAYTKAQLASQKTLVGQLNEKFSAPCHLLEKTGLGTEINTPLYHGGIVFPDHGALHPGKYHKGLLEAVLRRGIPVVAECPAQEIRSVVGGKQITTPKGTIAAEKVVMATNGYTVGGFGWYMRRVFPVPSYLIATEPLSANLIDGLAPARRMMVETRARHSYFRVSPDGTRILFGGRASIVNIDLRLAARRLAGTLCEIWPEMKGVKLSHVWTGNTGYTFAHMPSVGTHDGVHYAMGYSGSGTVMAPYLGAKAALQALGDPEGETAYSRLPLAPRWFHHGRTPHFMKAADLWYHNWVDWREKRASER